MYSLETIRRNVFRMFESTYDEKSCVKVRFDAGETAGRLADCRGLEDDERALAVEKIVRSIHSFFWYDKRGEGDFLLYLNYNQRNRVLRLEGRYFTQETCLEFAIASGMDYDGYRRFSGFIMGFCWNYLRNPEYLVGDFCLRFGLAPKRYRELTDYARAAANSPHHEEYCTNNTVDFNHQYNELICQIEEFRDSLSEEEMISEFRAFIDDHTAYLKGNFSRTLGYIRQMVRFPASGSFLEKICGCAGRPNVSRLNVQLVRATMSWEYKSPFRPEDGVSALFGVDAAPADITIARHTDLYCINNPDNADGSLPGYSPSEKESKRRVDTGRKNFTENYRFDMANMQVIRNDLVRILLMNMTDAEKGLVYIDLALECNSFAALSDFNPFDYLVKCALEIYGASEEEKPEELRGLDVYDVLCGLKDSLSLE